MSPVCPAPRRRPLAQTGSAAASPTATVTTDVFLAYNDSALAAFATSVSTPGSDDYQHFLTPAEVQTRFGPTPAQLAAVEHWLTGAGLHVTTVNAQELKATGTSAQTGAAFDTSLERYSDATGSFTAPSGAASIPADVSASVLGVLGLSSRESLVQPAPLDRLGNPATGDPATGDPATGDPATSNPTISARRQALSRPPRRRSRTVPKGVPKVCRTWAGRRARRTSGS